MNEIQHRLLIGGGVIDRRSNRDLIGPLDAALRTRRLVALHPGVYCVPEAVDDIDTRIVAAAVWAGPDAVVTGHAAARLTFAPATRVPVVTLALPTTLRRGSASVHFQRRRIPPELIVHRGPIAITRSCLTAVDLAGTPAGGAMIDEVLRSRTATLAQLWQAFELTPCRPGNQQRRRLLDESRHEPWSEAERELHRLLHSSGIRGWSGNRSALGYYADVLFDAAMLVLEADGWDPHSTRTAFEADRRRRNELVLAGYRVLNFTWRQLTEDPDWVIDCVLRALADGEVSRDRTRPRDPRSA